MSYIDHYEFISAAGENAAAAFRRLESGSVSVAAVGPYAGYKIANYENALVQSAPNYPEQQDRQKKNYSLAQDAKSLILQEDRSLVLLDHVASRTPFQSIYSLQEREKMGVLVGTSRGASELLETSYRRFFGGKRLSPKTSPYTTAGTLSTYISQKYGLLGGGFTVSSACTAGLNAAGTAHELIKSGLLSTVFVGATEAPLTPFTLEILNSAGVMKMEREHLFSFSGSGGHTPGMILGEGASCYTLSAKRSPFSKAEILSFSMAGENSGMTGISQNATGLQKAVVSAMQKADLHPRDIDFISVHGSGTKKGDLSEQKAYIEIFGKHLPPLLISKWATGHTLGASGLLSLGFTLKAFETQSIPAPPYEAYRGNDLNKELKTALVTGLGFGGGASAIIVKNILPVQ